MKKTAMNLVWGIVFAAMLALVFSELFPSVSYVAWLYGFLFYIAIRGYIDSLGGLEVSLGRKRAKYRELGQGIRKVPVTLESSLKIASQTGESYVEMEDHDGYFLSTERGIGIKQSVVEDFVRYAWAKQETVGKSGLSRNYWTKVRRPRLRVDEYEAIIEWLLDNYYIEGRKQGSSGVLNQSSDFIIKRIRRY